MPNNISIFFVTWKVNNHKQILQNRKYKIYYSAR